MMQMQGIIRGRQIELEREAGLPPGSAVIVNIQPKPLTLKEKRRLVDLLCGAWADDASLWPVFAEIEHQRAISTPREADFDVAS